MIIKLIHKFTSEASLLTTLQYCSLIKKFDDSFLFLNYCATKTKQIFFIFINNRKLFNLDILLLLNFFSYFSVKKEINNFFFMTFKSFLPFYVLTIDLSRQLFISFLSESISKKYKIMSSYKLMDTLDGCGAFGDDKSFMMF